MKKLLIAVILTIFSIGINAQKGSHSFSVNMTVSDVQWKWYTVLYPHINSQNLLGLKYQYGLSEMFRVATDFNYKIDNETPLDYNMSLSLHTNFLKRRAVNEDGTKDILRLYALSGISYAGIDSFLDNGNKIGGRIGFGYEVSSDNDPLVSNAEFGYDTKQKWFFSFALGFRF